MPEDNTTLSEENNLSVDSLLTEISKKYGLEENMDQTIEKLESDEPLCSEIIAVISYDFARNKISDKEISPSLKNKLNIPEETAKKYPRK